MIKQSETHEKPVFGNVEPKRKRQTNKAEKPTTQPVPEKLCAFQVLIEAQAKVPWERVMKSEQCKEPALQNGWCQEHKHAQAGMDEGERLGWRSVEVPMCAYFAENSVHQFTLIIGHGKQNWLAYFEKARDPGLSTVLRYLEKQV